LGGRGDMPTSPGGSYICKQSLKDRRSEYLQDIRLDKLKIRKETKNIFTYNPAISVKYRNP
jgi:hypothetical protein